ncbi:hypothetical protein CB1_000878033 [Camelus ferus]|nr:hypothetical protein CB1_000878033 [Camelus ferus]
MPPFPGANPYCPAELKSANSNYEPLHWQILQMPCFTESGGPKLVARSGAATGGKVIGDGGGGSGRVPADTMLVELKNGETYNGHLVSCDNWMNINLREVICTSRVSPLCPEFAPAAWGPKDSTGMDGDKFWRMPECYIRGSTIKYLRIPDEIIDMVKEEVVAKGRGRGGLQQQKQQKGRGMGGAGRGGLDGSCPPHPSSWTLGSTRPGICNMRVPSGSARDLVSSDVPLWTKSYLTSEGY